MHSATGIDVRDSGYKTVVAPTRARAGARSDRRVGSGAGRGRQSSETQVVALIRQAGCRSFLSPCSRTRGRGRNGGGACCVWPPGYQVLHLSTGSTVTARKYRPTPVAVVARRTTSPAPPDRTRLLPPSNTTVAQFLRLKAASPPKLTVEIASDLYTYRHTPSSFWSLGWGKMERINTSTHTHTYYTAKFTHASSRVFFGNFVL